MEQSKENRSGSEDIFSTFTKSMNKFWEDMIKMTCGLTGSSNKSGEGVACKAQKNWETGFKVFQSFISTFSKPENLESLLKGADYFPDILNATAKQIIESGFEIQKQWAEHLRKLGKKSKAYSFDDIDQDTFNAIREIYEEELKKFFNIPQLGLTRSYQEKFNALMDRYNQYRLHFSEFLYLFYVPMEKTAQVMQEKIANMAETGELHDDFKDYYRMWVRVLEGHYMTLLKSPEYTKVMDNTITSMIEYKEAKEDFFCDLLKNFPVPTNRDMDELYKDIYLLKKKVKELSKKLESYMPDEGK